MFKQRNSKWISSEHILLHKCQHGNSTFLCSRSKERRGLLLGTDPSITLGARELSSNAPLPLRGIEGEGSRALQGTKVGNINTVGFSIKSYVEKSANLDSSYSIALRILTSFMCYLFVGTHDYEF